jgi:2-oxo-4-hydroxy-4-carboxy-5-ureidoimidazoline decarboxylase
MRSVRVTLAELNAGGRQEFLSACSGLFEGSPWVAERAWLARPFHTLEALHREMVAALHGASLGEKLGLIRAHPDLVGRLSARTPALGVHSAREQAAAGLDSLTEEEARMFRSFNEEYHGKFGFPFVICAKENRKDAILQAFPRRLSQEREREIETALAEIGKIAWLRLHDTVSEE